MKDLPTIIFDFDGTLADSEKYVFEIFQKLSKKYLKRRLTIKEIEKLRLERQQNLLKHLKISVFELAKIISEIRKELNKSIHLVKPYKGIKKVLSYLKKKEISMGIVSTNSQENIKIFLEKNKMDFFDFLNCGTSLLGKGRILSKVIKERKYKKENVIYVGDEIRDIDAARKIKIKVAVVTWGFNPKEALIKYNPDFIIEKPEELLLLVK